MSDLFLGGKAVQCQKDDIGGSLRPGLYGEFEVPSCVHGQPNPLQHYRQDRAFIRIFSDQQSIHVRHLRVIPSKAVDGVKPDNLPSGEYRSTSVTTATIRVAISRQQPGLLLKKGHRV
jgi:hypothetical protein